MSSAAASDVSTSQSDSHTSCSSSASSSSSSSSSDSSVSSSNSNSSGVSTSSSSDGITASSEEYSLLNSSSNPYDIQISNFGSLTTLTINKHTRHLMTEQDKVMEQRMMKTTSNIRPADHTSNLSSVCECSLDEFQSQAELGKWTEEGGCTACAAGYARVDQITSVAENSKPVVVRKWACREFGESDLDNVTEDAMELMALLPNFDHMSAEEKSAIKAVFLQTSRCAVVVGMSLEYRSRQRFSHADSIELARGAAQHCAAEAQIAIEKARAVALANTPVKKRKQDDAVSFD